MAYLDDLFSLEGRVAVVTGGAGALPADLALALAKAGAKVALWGRGTNHPVAEAAARLLAETGVIEDRVAAITVDTSDGEAVTRAIAETETLLGPPDLLLNGVGGNKGKSAFVDLDEKIFAEVLSLNLLAGLVTPTRAFAKYWIARGIQGDVIVMNSMASYKALSGIWAYDAAKAGALNLTEGLAKELAPKGIRVNGIAPGFFIGHQNRALLVEEDGSLTARGRSIVAHTPFGRFGEREELRGALLFLASRRASAFVTGVTIPVDGGYLTDNI